MAVPFHRAEYNREFSAVDQHKSEIEKFLDETELYYIVRDNIFYQFTDEKGWEHITYQEFKRHSLFDASRYKYQGTTTKPHHWAKDYIHDTNREKVKIYVSGNDKDDADLNVFSKEGWVKPENTGAKIGRIFYILMEAISNGSHEFQKHIKLCLLQKLENPHRFDIPAICWHGAGRAGKNTFVSALFQTIFNGSVQSGKFGEFFAQHNSLVFGKAVCFIDENKPTSTQVGPLRRTVGNETINVNPKYVKPFTTDNVAWFFFATNDPKGCVALQGDDVDRRFSIISLEHNIQHWIEIDRANFPQDDGNLEPVSWWKKHIASDLKDKKQVAQWLWEIRQEFGVLNDYDDIEGFHGEDYNRLVFKQKPHHEKILQIVLNSNMISGVFGNQLYQFYNSTLPRNAVPLTAGEFGAQVSEFLKKDAISGNWEDKINKGNRVIRNKNPLKDGVSRQELKYSEIDGCWSVSYDDLLQEYSSNFGKTVEVDNEAETEVDPMEVLRDTLAKIPAITSDDSIINLTMMLLDILPIDVLLDDAIPIRDKITTARSIIQDVMHNDIPDDIIPNIRDNLFDTMVGELFYPDYEAIKHEEERLDDIIDAEAGDAELKKN